MYSTRDRQHFSRQFLIKENKSDQEGAHYEKVFNVLCRPTTLAPQSHIHSNTSTPASSSLQASISWYTHRASYDYPVKRSILFTFVGLDFAKICAVCAIRYRLSVPSGLPAPRFTSYTVYTVKKGYRFSRPQTRYRLPTFTGRE
jgi:hypothetical protein